MQSRNVTKDRQFKHGFLVADVNDSDTGDLTDSDRKWSWMTTYLGLSDIRAWQRRVREYFAKQRWEDKVWIMLIGNSAMYAGIDTEDILKFRAQGETYEVNKRAERRFVAS